MAGVSVLQNFNKNEDLDSRALLWTHTNEIWTSSPASSLVNYYILKRLSVRMAYFI